MGTATDFQDLSSTFARLCHLVDETTAEMKKNLVDIDRSMLELQEVAAKSNQLEGKSADIENKLQKFRQSYLPDC